MNSVFLSIPASSLIGVFRALASIIFENCLLLEHNNPPQLTSKWIEFAFGVIKITKLVSRSLSFQFLILMLQSISLFICCIYNAIDMAINPNAPLFFKIWATTLQIDMLLLFLCYILLINFPSEAVKNKMKDLRHLALSLNTSEDSKMEIDGQIYTETYARTWLVDQLNEFQGFDMGGFANLGKPLLGSIVANTLTYLIVLIQFKLNENAA